MHYNKLVFFLILFIDNGEIFVIIFVNICYYKKLYVHIYFISVHKVFFFLRYIFLKIHLFISIRKLSLKAHLKTL